ncbi:MAG: hypothetical protein AABY07_06555, partial [Nanoarchaeota archaeon]
ILQLEDDAGHISEEVVSFFVDSEAPDFNELMPEKNDYATGEFSVEITEEAELVNVKLHYGVAGDMRMLDLGDSCGTGEDVLCSAVVDLSDFDNTEELEYYFEASDQVNTVQSKTTSDVMVDISAPEIVSLEYVIDEDDVDFTIEVSEDDVKISYSDNGGNLKTLCSGADTDDPCEKEKSFDDGDHEVILQLEDDAGHISEEVVSFMIQT